jgi:hypothetical protein
MEVMQVAIIKKTRISLRNDSSANWLANDDVVLLKGEVGIEFTFDGTPKLKIGDGLNTWSSLPYFNSSAGITSINENILVLDENNLLSILGFENAEPGAYLIKDESGKAIWSRSEIELLTTLVNNRVEKKYSIIDGIKMPWTLLSPENAQKLEALDSNGNITPTIHADNIVGLSEYLTKHRNSINALLSEVEELKLITVEPYAQENIIEAIAVGDNTNLASIINKAAHIPFASTSQSGVIKLSEEIGIDENNAL